MNTWFTWIRIRIYTKVAREPPVVLDNSGCGICLVVNEAKDVLGCVGDCEGFPRRLDIWDNGA
jgi:hypothetical protein